MYKMWVIAKREYLAAVRTKAFVIGLLIMPVLMGGSVFIQWLVKDLVDTEDKKFVVVDRVGDPGAVFALRAAIDKYNETQTRDASGKQIKPRYVVEAVAAAEMETQNLELSEKVRQGELVGFLEMLGPDAFSPPAGLKDAKVYQPSIVLRYHTNRPTYRDFAVMAEGIVDGFKRAKIAEPYKMPADVLGTLLKPALLENKGLSKKDAAGNIVEGTEASQIASVVAPMVLTILMFMVVLMGATPLMQGVVEEKMQRIAEVLLGSVQPFPLMMGKLIGMTGVSLTISLVYLGGAYWAAHHYGFAEHVPLGLLAWFLLFQALAALMFGSLFIAIGAACTEMRETQNLLWPVMVLATAPMFLLGSVLREPNGPVVRGVSFFPFATPALMIARMAVPPGVPWWEPAVAILGVLATTVFCVYAAGRIFRVGILLQGKGARLSEILRWVLRG
jgi:ABC-2 type transport system permease protein